MSRAHQGYWACIENLPKYLKHRDLLKIFAGTGFKSAHIAMMNGVSRGCAYVQFYSEEDRESVIREKDHQTVRLGGDTILIKLSKTTREVVAEDTDDGKLDSDSVSSDSEAEELARRIGDGRNSELNDKSWGKEVAAPKGHSSPPKAPQQNEKGCLKELNFEEMNQVRQRLKKPPLRPASLQGLSYEPRVVATKQASSSRIDKYPISFSSSLSKSRSNRARAKPLSPKNSQIVDEWTPPQSHSPKSSPQASFGSPKRPDDDWESPPKTSPKYESPNKSANEDPRGQSHSSPKPKHMDNSQSRVDRVLFPSEPKQERETEASYSLSRSIQNKNSPTTYRSNARPPANEPKSKPEHQVPTEQPLVQRLRESPRQSESEHVTPKEATRKSLTSSKDIKQDIDTTKKDEFLLQAEAMIRELRASKTKETERNEHPLKSEEEAKLEQKLEGEKQDERYREAMNKKIWDMYLAAYPQRTEDLDGFKWPFRVTLMFKGRAKVVLVTTNDYSFRQLIKDYTPKGTRSDDLRCKSLNHVWSKRDMVTDLRSLKGNDGKNIVTFMPWD